MWLIIVLKVAKKQDFTLSLEDTFLEKSQARRLKWFCNFVKFRINNILQKKLFAGWNFADHGFGMVFLVISQSYYVIIKFSSFFAPHNLPKHVPKKLWLLHGENVCKIEVSIKAFQLQLQRKYRKYTFLGLSSGSNPYCYLNYLHEDFFPKTNSTGDMNEGTYWHTLQQM